MLCLVAGVAALALGGCGGGGDTPEEPAGLAEEIIQAEQSGAETAENPASFISLCANCHDSLDRALDWREQRKLIFNHAAHFAVGVRCDACHTEFPHKPGKTLHVPLDTCFECHGSTHGVQGTLAPTECTVCHTRDIARITPDHNANTWVFQPGDGLARHSRSATERPLYCKMCHESTFCLNCHEIDMPHPDTWMTSEGTEGELVHGAVADAEGREVCFNCHESINYCNNCHHAGFERMADWQADHKTLVRKSGADLCFDCHEPPFCSACHVGVGKERDVHEGEG
jgi:hypothetical protein